MRGAVRRIFSPGHENINAAFYALFLLFLLVFARQEAEAQEPVFSALKIQAERQPPRPRAARPTAPRKKQGLSPIQNNEAAEGSRVTITYNEPLSDYSAYRSGDQFVVVIPKSDAPRIRSGLRGRGFEGVQVEKRGDDTVLSFRIRPGTKARVDQQHNRLEVIFSKPGQSVPTIVTGSQPNASAASAVKPPQGTPAAPPRSQTQAPMANQNSTVAAQPSGAGAHLTADATAATTTTQTGAAAPPDSTRTPSTEDSTAQTQPSTDKTVSAGVVPTPLPEPRTTFGAVQTLATRHWLLLLIGIALLASAYLGLRARRGGALQSGEAKESAALTEETEDEAAVAQSSRSGIAAEASAVVEKSAPVNKEKLIKVAAMAAGSAHLTTSDVAQRAAAEAAADSLPFEQPALTESVATVAPAKSVEAANVEEQQELQVEVAETEQLMELNRGKADQAETADIDKPNPNQEPVPPDEALRFTADTKSNGFEARAEDERAQSVLRLAELGDDDAFLKIGAAFDDPAQQVRDAAARSLFNFSADRVASFKRIMQESSTERRRKIGEAIASSGMAGEAINDLTSASGEKAYDALLVLSLMAKAGEVQSLVNTIEEHPSTEVRLALVKLLALSGRQEVVSAFRYLSTRDQLPIAVRSSIMEAIYQINNPRFDLS